MQEMWENIGQSFFDQPVLMHPPTAICLPNSDPTDRKKDYPKIYYFPNMLLIKLFDSIGT